MSKKTENILKKRSKKIKTTSRLNKFEDIADDARCFLQGKMSEKEAGAFLQFLETHPELKDEFELMKKMVSVMRDIPEEELKDRLSQTKSEELNRPDQVKTSLNFYVVAITALIIVLVVLLYYADRQKAIQPRSNDPQGISTYAGSEKTGLYANTASSLVIDSNGGIYIAGNFYHEITVGNHLLRGDSTSVDFFIMQLAPDLEVEWAKAYGGDGNDYLDGIALDNQSNLIIRGRIGGDIELDDINISPKSDNRKNGSSDLFIAKLDRNRRVVWAVHDGYPNVPYLSSGRGKIKDLVIDQENNIFAIGGISADSILKHPIPQTKAANAFLMKMDASGEIQWVRNMVGEYGVRFYALDIWQSDLQVVGSFGHANLSGDIVINDQIIPSHGGTDILVAQFDTSGNLQWSQTFGSARLGLGENAYDVETSHNGDHILVTGEFDGISQFANTKFEATNGRDFFLASLDHSGQLEWFNQGGGGTSESKNTDQDLGAALAIDMQGNILVCGIFAKDALFGDYRLHPTGIQDLFVAKYSPQGELLWIKPFGGDSEKVNMERAMDLVVAKNGDTYVTGFFSGDLFIDDQKLEAGGNTNIFILVLDSAGRIKNFNKVLYVSLDQDTDQPS